MTNYVVFGDSIVRGNYDPKNGGWVRILASQVEKKPYGKRNQYIDRVYNCGISGDTSSDLLKRFKIELLARKPDVVLIGIGINDSRQDIKRKYLVDIDEFKNNIGKIFKVCLANNIKKVILTGITRVDEKVLNPWKDTGYYYNKSIKIYDDAVEKFAKSNNLSYIPMHDVLNNSDLFDGLHPNAKGHRKMYKRVKSYLDKYVKI